MHIFVCISYAYSPGWAARSQDWSLRGSSAKRQIGICLRQTTLGKLSKVVVIYLFFSVYSMYNITSLTHKFEFWHQNHNMTAPNFGGEI